MDAKAAFEDDEELVDDECIDDVLLGRLLGNTDLLTDAISEEQIANANLVQLTAALATLIDRAERLRDREPLRGIADSELMRFTAAVRRHVADPRIREAIAADLDALFG